ncbi:spermidine/spermine N(1)-acetyltransferase-like protein 1 isoform X3 [Engystomops pustulosus]|uniref:spermidine/spermine N(1)-acetyltransferase-like protein 1 isoform X3 n=1 Tax=Engystomops pustulosus TaxID=76066 RepID=UPI003AFB55D7
MECIIRPAEPRDSPHIMRMIRELAEYEKITHFITLSEDVLHRDGFGETPWFRSVVAELPEAERSETGVPFAGYALFANSYSSWTGRTLHLEDLYVSPRFRGRGLGRRLMARVAQEGLRSGCSQIHLSVLKWNTPAVSLYRSLGAQNLTEEPGYQELADFEKLSDQVKITAEELRRDGFEEPSPLFRCLVVENSEEEEQDTSWCTAPPPSCISCVRGRRLMGYALFFFTYSTWEGRSLYLEDLYIRPQYRGKGIGSRLFTAVTELCLSLGCARLQLSVLDWNHSAISFYRSRGARDLTQEEGWRVFRFLPDDLRRIGSS